MKLSYRLISSIFVCGLLSATSAIAATIRNGVAFTIAGGGSRPNTNSYTHFHGNAQSGIPTDPGGMAEVGRYLDEYIGGYSEFNITGLKTLPVVFATFKVWNTGGLYEHVNNTPFIGSVSVSSYAGNESYLDYDLDWFNPRTNFIGSFAVGPGLKIGDVINVDVSRAYNAAVANGYSLLGLRLGARVDNNIDASEAWTFSRFSLTDNGVASVPEPTSWTMMIFGFGAVGASVRRRHVTRFQERRASMIGG